MSPPRVDALEDRLMGVVLPASAWLAIVTSHVDWATQEAETLDPDERVRVARQLRLLFEAARAGASPANDSLLTDTRELVDVACELLGHVADTEDTRLAAQLVYPHAVLCSAITKLTRLAGQQGT